MNWLFIEQKSRELIGQAAANLPILLCSLLEAKVGFSAPGGECVWECKCMRIGQPQMAIKSWHLCQGVLFFVRSHAALMTFYAATGNSGRGQCLIGTLCVCEWLTIPFHSCDEGKAFLGMQKQKINCPFYQQNHKTIQLLYTAAPTFPFAISALSGS